MKIMQINCVFNRGSTGKIIYDLDNYFTNNGHQVINIIGEGKDTFGKNVHFILNKFLRIINTVYTYIFGYMYKGSMIGTLRLIKYVRRYNPDIINLHSVNGHMINIYKLVKWLKKKKYPLVVVNHAEFFYTGSYSYAPIESNQWRTGGSEKIKDAKKMTNSLFFDKTRESLLEMKKSFNKYTNLRVISVSPWVFERSSSSLVFKDKINSVILNGVDTSIFRKKDVYNLSDLYNKTDEKIILHVTSGFENRLKGSKYMIELANTMKDLNYKFLFVGINKEIELPSNCVNLGTIKDQKELASLYSFADVTVITSLRETFSMVVAESLCCGTPVAGFFAGGPESITIPEYSRFVEYGNVDELAKAVIKLSETKNNSISIQAHLKFSKESMGEKYLNVYKELLKTGEKYV